MSYCIINGDLHNIATASLGITDLALQRGYGIFDYFKILKGRPVFLDDHLDRFYHSAGKLRLDIGHSRQEIIAMIYSLIKKNEMDESGIKLLLTGGYSLDGFNMGKPNLVITQGKLPSYSDSMQKGIRIITYHHQRQMPGIKTIDYLMAVWLQPVLKEHDAQDVLYHDGNYITECPRSNIFIVTPDKQVLTPLRNVLPGVIRKQLLKLETDFRISETEITLKELRSASEVFLTSTTKNILPVYQVDDQVVGNGKPGPVTLKLISSLDAVIRATPQMVN